MGICNVQVTMTFPASLILRSQGWGVLKEQLRFASSLTLPRMMMWGNMWTHTAAHLSLLQVSVVFKNFHLSFIGLFMYVPGNIAAVLKWFGKRWDLCKSLIFSSFRQEEEQSTQDPEIGDSPYLAEEAPESGNQEAESCKGQDWSCRVPKASGTPYQGTTWA